MSSAIGKITCVAAALVVIFFLFNNQSLATENELSDTRKVELIHIVKQDCGSCHGMTLKGGLGPALLLEDLQDKPLLFIQNTILYGRSGTAMPPWKSLLSEQEALWIAKQLKQGKVTQVQTQSHKALNKNK